MYIRGLIPRNFAELAEAVPIECAYFLFYGFWERCNTKSHTIVKKELSSPSVFTSCLIR